MWEYYPMMAKGEGGKYIETAGYGVLAIAYDYVVYAERPMSLSSEMGFLGFYGVYEFGNTPEEAMENAKLATQEFDNRINIK